MRSLCAGLVASPHVRSQSRPADERDPVLSRGARTGHDRAGKSDCFTGYFSGGRKKEFAAIVSSLSLARLKKKKQRSNEGGRGAF
ncbi:hypothetical protein CEXT_335611 [Caerostris extrusa]|uniref:Secreted protein n=1 Tax=Caerostris extrusa TaxID=172846 RepID=A0AAV4W576_CAEEX|nr:hypothetical protein CEXT_335611 [Caerostris extrusa]